MTAVGDALSPFTVEAVDPEAMKVWAEALRDPNPIHLDRDAVRAAGLGERRINQGPANLAYVVNMLTAAFPDHRVAALALRFGGNVLEGDRVTAGGTVTRIDGGTVECDVRLDADGRGTVLSGTARMEGKH